MFFCVRVVATQHGICVILREPLQNLSYYCINFSFYMPKVMLVSYIFCTFAMRIKLNTYNYDTF